MLFTGFKLNIRISIYAIVSKKETVNLSPSQFFRCLSDETRMNATLLIFQQKELCVCELTEALALSQPKVSRHLAQLRNCGVLSDTRRGQWVYYSLHPELPTWALNILQQALDAQMPLLDTCCQRLKTMLDRPVCC